MAADVRTILRLQMPVIVQIARRSMRMNDVINLMPGAIIELPKTVDEPLDLMVNNVAVGHGTAVKVGENFGLKITALGDVRARVAALGGSEAKKSTTEDPDDASQEDSAETAEPAEAAASTT